MSTARMLSVSLILTLCFATIGTLVLLFTGDKSPLKQSEDTAQEIAASAAPSEPAPQQKQVASQGIRTETDELGFHDILFESDEDIQTVSSGPVQLTVTKRRLEVLTTEDEHIRKSMEGRQTSTVTILDVTVVNSSDQVVTFKMDEAKFTTDLGEKAVINAKLSTMFGEELAPNETKKGRIMIDFATKARNIATIQLHTFPAYNQQYDALGEAINLEIPMF